MNGRIKTLVNVCLIIALYYFIYYIYQGLLNPVPALGDSWDYHIPIANTIINGSFLHLSNVVLPKWYYPGSSEAFTAVFILLKIPTLSNIFAAIALFFACWKLGKTFNLSRHFAILFAVAFITLNIVLRWLNAISIDFWVGVFFVLSIILLERPKKSSLYFVQLGFTFGMLIGSKYSAIFFVLLLSIFYFKTLVRFLNIKRMVAFLIPFFIFGLFWYVRNYFSTSNPFYPMHILGFKGSELIGNNVLTEILKHPLDLLNAVFGEYKLWLLSVLVALGALIHQFIIKKEFKLNSISKLFLIGLINLIFYFSFPSSIHPWDMVSGLRYSLPASIPLMLGVFMLAQEYKKEELLAYFTLINMVNVLTMTYYPKLLLIYLPISVAIIYLLNRNLKLKSS